ncbi:hypothetical protein Misp01_42590 [Microtetraspora sp. NBRC 13810]|uniref:RHS repeat-associated core domain-containing protein n=1 Tax=Microtetraspora sp. NBRC 13810 TaxID=3030990 RepID=UPI0024A39A24|nr:RHS repeat-associated core domain-containing protein [Microtetraspora sp. NBRC 13810]GLW09130.1 hypothetical protein Misp01_42590 [Microtetraspora sp. NBRC 13810]
MAIVLVASLLAPAPARAAQDWDPAGPQPQWSVPGRVAEPGKPLPDPGAASAVTAPRVVWPAPGVATVRPPEAPAAARAVPPMARAGTLPVWVGPPASAPGGERRTAAAPPPPAQAQVRVLDGQTADRARITGLGLQVAAAGRVSLRLDYSGFRHAYGGDWGSRLRLVRLAPCALTTPDRPGCQARTPLETVNDAEAGHLTADVDATAAGTLLAAEAGPSGPAGDYKATSLSPSATWSVSNQTGAFSWNHPMRIPPAPGGPVPTVALNYSSGGVDGRTVSTNNQTSWVGEGFDYWPGYIERRYRQCSDDGVTPERADLCWRYDNATMSLNGRATELIRDDATGAWRPKDDDGSRIEKLTGAQNGDRDGEHWRVTSPDGIQYYFGLNRLPGWQSGNPETRSTWTVPVMGDDGGEPCHKAGDLAGSYCDQPWRWNLDYVVDPRGTASTFWYTPETNHYRRDVTTLTDGQPNGTPDEYVRGGFLHRIDYGQRSDSIFTGHAAGRVRFHTAERCIPTSDFDCAESKFTAANASRWPDVPFDQECKAGQECVDNYSATFWSRKRLTGITTQVLKDGTFKDVDTWTLRQEMRAPGDGTAASLWLDGVQHTGKVAGSATLPEVRFGGVQLPNRVDALEGLPPLTKWRVSSIENETGGGLSIGYSEPDCEAGRTPEPDSNTRRCYPQYWSPGDAAEPERDWFHKYVVTRVEELDHTGGAPAKVAAYEYLGGGAWHHADDDGLTDEKYKTWSEWRGYGRVRVVHGDASEPRSMTEYRYFRGMDGDRQDGGGTREATVTDSEGTEMADQEFLNGFVREEIKYDGPAAERIVSATVNDPWSRKTAERERSWATTTARMVKPGRSHVRKAVGDDWRRTRIDTAYNDDGQPAEVSDLGDLATAADDRCTRTNYARDGDRWMVSYVSRAETVAKACAAEPSRPGDVIADVRTYYDGLSWDAAPTRGDVTRTAKLASYTGGEPRYVTISTSTFDAYGRPLETANAAGHKTTQTYAPGTGPVTRTVQTDATGGVTTTDLDPSWGQPTATVDVNGKRTEMTYDPLGRLTGVWLPGRAASATPNLRFAYLIRADAPTVVSTSTLRNDGATYTTGHAIYDGLLRPRQTQQPAPGGGRLVKDTFYDTRGLVAKSNHDYYNEQPPGTALWEPAGDDDVPGQTVTTYNGMELPTASVFRVRGTEQWRTTTTYDGDRVHVDPPPGSTPTTTISDARGRTTEVRHYQGDGPTGPYDATRHTYTPSGRQATMRDAQGSTWTYHYDLRDRQIRVDDPGKGTTTLAYDDLDRLTTSTDARGSSLHTTYDVLGRRTALYEGADAGGFKLAEWTYDRLAGGTVVKGQQVSATRYVRNAAGGADAYTTRVTGFDDAYRPTGTEVVIPASERGLAGTYATTTEYNLDGTPRRTGLPQGGGLLAETLLYGYDELGNPTTLRGLTGYVTSTVYSKLGLPLQTTLTDGGPRVLHSNLYEQGTNRLSRALTERETVPRSVADVSYTYDAGGNHTKIADTPSGQTPDVQCFTHDHMQRLTRAWTGTDQCAAAPTPGDAATIIGGAAPYWQSFAYDVVGNRTRETAHDPGGDTAKDVTRTFAYAGPERAQPHTLTSVAHRGGPRDGQTDAYTYDAAGNTTQRGTGRTLEWDAQNKPTKSTDDGKVSTYVYDAEGNRLIRRDDTGATLTVAGMEIRYDAAAGATVATRYYTHGGATVAVRTRTGLTWLRADHHGTAEITVTATAQAVTRRRTTPFGGPRGTAPASWPGERGFVGGTVDLATGLTSLGARLYDPATGRFLSLDPLFDRANPQTWNGYTYANNNPVTQSDPTGLFPMGGDNCVTLGCASGDHRGQNGGGGGGGGGGGSGSNGGGVGYGGGYAAPPPTPSYLPQQTCDWWCQAAPVVVNVSVTVVVGGVCLAATSGAGSIACALGAGAAGSAAEYYLFTPRDEQTVGDAVTRTAFGAVSNAAGVGVGGSLLGGLGRIGTTSAGASTVNGVTRAAARPGSAVAGQSRRLGREAREEADEAASCPVNSFVPGTRVLLADGTTKPIEKVRLGDKVLATDPEAGKTAAKQVTALIRGQGTKKLVAVTVDTDGTRGTATATITATDGHPFWLPRTREWADAGELRPGMWLRTPAASDLRITATRVWAAQERVYNLTVAGIHTYYALAGAAPILVHNSNCPNGRLSDRLPQGLSRHFVNAYDDIRAGRGVPQTDPGTGRQRVFQGREEHGRSWAGSLEYRVPGTSGDDFRILMRTLPDGRTVMGWTTNHYRTINRFSAPHFPDFGW